MTIPRPKSRWTVKTWMTAIALVAVIVYCCMLVVRSYIWMIKAGW